MTTKIIIWKEEYSLENDISKTFLEAWEEKWINIPFSCRNGFCFSCACRIKKWKEFINRELQWNDMVTDPNDDIILTCVAWPTDSNAEIELETI